MLSIPPCHRLLCLMAAAPIVGAQATYSSDPDVSVGWEQMLEQSLPGSDDVRDVATSPGRVFVLIETRPSGPDAAMVFAHDAETGAVLWASEYRGPDDLHVFDAEFLAAAPDGSRVFAVYKERHFTDPLVGQIPRNFTVVAYDGATGAELWTMVFEVLEPLEPTPFDVAVSNDGELLYVAGKLAAIVPLFKLDTARDGFLVAVRAVDGSIAWSDGYDGPGGTFDSVEAIAVDPASDRLYSVLTVGVSSFGDEILTRAHDASTGQLLWERSHAAEDGEQDEARDVTSDGVHVFVGCRTGTAPSLVTYMANDGTPVGSETLEGRDVVALEVSPGGEALAAQVSGEPPRVLSLPLAPGAPGWAFDLPVPDESLRSRGLSFSSDGARLLAAVQPGDASEQANFDVFVLDAGTGQEGWSLSPTVTGSFPIVGDFQARILGDRALLAYDVETTTGRATRVDSRELDTGLLGWTVDETGLKPDAITWVTDAILSPDGARAWLTTREYLPEDGVGVELVFGVREIDLDTGESLWFSALPEATLDPPGDLVAGPGPGRVSVLERTADGIRAIALDASSGDTLWESTWDGLGSFPLVSDGPMAGAAAPAGSALYATGYVGLAGELGRRIGTVAFAAEDGDILWDADYADLPGTPTTGEDVTTSPDGSRVFVVGTTWNGVDTDLAVVAYDAGTGAELWAHVFGGASNESGHSIVVAPDGSRVYASGTVYSPTDAREVLGAAALDAATGAVLWVDTGGAIPSLGLGETFAAGSALSPDGSTLYHAGHAPLDVELLAVRVAAVDTATGVRVWTYGETATEGLEAVDFARTPDGRALHLLGWTELNSIDSLRTLALDAQSGERLWRVDRTEVITTPTNLAVGESFSLVAGRGSPGFPATTTARWLRLDHAALQSAPDGISLAAGGSQTLQLTAGPELAESRYWVLGSASGTAPGLGIGGQLLPLVPDAYFLLSLTAANLAPFVGTLGLFDAQGKGTAAIVLPAGLDPTLAGIELNHAFVAFLPGGSVQFVSHASPLLLVP